MTKQKQEKLVRAGKKERIETEKQSRQAAYMKKLARAVIEIDSHGNVLSCEVAPFGWHANYLVVIEQKETQWGKHEIIRLEVGFGRRVPYSGFLFFQNNKPVRIHEKRKHVPLERKILLKILPKVTDIIQDVIDQGVKSWKHGIHSVRHTRPKSKGGATLLKGLFITVSRTDELLSFIILSRVMRERALRLRKWVHEIKRAWKGLRFSNYSKQELATNVNIREFIDKIQESYTKEQLDILASHLGSPAKSKERALFDSILENFNIRTRKPEAYEQFFAELKEKHASFEHLLEKLCHLSVAVHWKRDRARKKEAKECSRFEVHPSKKLMAELEQNAKPLKLTTKETVPEESIPEYHAEF